MQRSDEFADGIVALRVSGINVRRTLIQKATFEKLYGDFPRCIDMVLSNIAIGPEVEFDNVNRYAQQFDLAPKRLDPERRYIRSEIDTVSILSLMELRDNIIEDYEDDAHDMIKFVFDLGYTAGRNFSAIQNLMTVEPEAFKAMDARRKNVAKGKASGSDRRKTERLEQFLNEVERVFEENEALRDHEDILLKVAFSRVIPKGAYGHGQFNSYCTTLRSEQPYKLRFDRLFRNSVK